MSASFLSRSLAQLKELLANQRHDLKWHYEVGELVEQLVPERNHGTGVMKTACQTPRAASKLRARAIPAPRLRSFV